MKCSNCGGDIHFSPSDNLLKCNTCDYTSDISTEAQKTKQLLYSTKEHLTINSYVEHCSSCGAQSILNEQESSKNCPYCSSPVVKKNLTGLELPDNIIEFYITKEQSRDFVRQWMKSRWFAPNLFKQFGKENSLYDVEVVIYHFGLLMLTPLPYMKVKKEQEKQKKLETKLKPICHGKMFQVHFS